MIDKVKHTFSQLYLWKMSFEEETGAQIHTFEDFKVERYDLLVGKNF